MKNMLTRIQALSPRKRLVVALLAALVFLTWLAVCVVLLLPAS